MKKLFASYKLFWEQVFDFKGKMSRGDYWRAILVHDIAVFIASVMIGAIFNLIFPYANIEAVVWLVFIAGGVLALAAGVRRLNDMGRTWKAMLWALIPGYGWIAVVCMLCRKSGAVQPKKPKNCRKGIHMWHYEKENCREVCTLCGATRAKHEYRRVSGECREKCTVCGNVQGVSHNMKNGVCTVCGYKDEKISLVGFTNEELSALRMAVDTMKQVNKDPNLTATYTTVRNKLNGSVPRLDVGELAITAACAVAVSQAIGSDVQKFITMGSNTGVNAANVMTALNVNSALGKLNKLIEGLNLNGNKEAPKDGKKPLSEFKSYDESYEGYVKGGVCDVCNKSLEGKKAYAVPNDVFYASKDYRDHLKKLQKDLFGLELTDKDIDFRAAQDKSPGSAVCEDCMPMFAAMEAAEEKPAEAKPEAPKPQPEKEEPKKNGTFYVFAAQGVAFGQASGDVVAEKAEALRADYAPAKEMDFKLVRPYDWGGRVNSSNSAGVISSSFSLSDCKDEVRKYLEKDGVAAAAIDAGIKESEGNSLQLMNPFSGVYVIGVPIRPVEEAKAEEAKPEEPKEEPKTEEPKVEEAKEEPAVEEVKEEPKAEPTYTEPVFLGRAQKDQYTYEYYRAASVADARKYLENRTVDLPLFYVMVRTDKGTWGKDKDGIFLEGLAPFQKDLSLRECDAAPAVIPERMIDLQMAARKITDNYLLSLTCGSCGGEWKDGVAYRAKTIVQCPHCGKYNLADTEYIHYNDL